MITLNDLCAHLLPPDEQLKFKTLIINEPHLIFVADHDVTQVDLSRLSSTHGPHP